MRPLPARGPADEAPVADRRPGSVYRKEEGWVEARGALWYYVQIGQGPSLVILKGGSDLLPALLPLAKTARLVLLDRPVDATDSVEDQVEQLEAVRASLRLGRIALMGSPGGLAEAYARKHRAQVRAVLAADVSDPGEVLKAVRSGRGSERALRSDGKPAPGSGPTGWAARFQNEHVRVLDQEVRPGEATPWLDWREWRDFATVVLGAADIVYEDASGARERVRREVGMVHYVAHGPEQGRYRVSNVGSTPYRQMRIELLAPRRSGFAPSVRAETPGCSLVLDNERVRAWRLALAPGQAGPPVTGAAPGLRVFLTAGRLAETADERPERTIELVPGGFEWQAASAARSVRNVGPSRVELVELELK